MAINSVYYSVQTESLNIIQVIKVFFIFTNGCTIYLLRITLKFTLKFTMKCKF